MPPFRMANDHEIDQLLELRRPDFTRGRHIVLPVHILRPNLDRRHRKGHLDRRQVDERRADDFLHPLDILDPFPQPVRQLVRGVQPQIALPVPRDYRGPAHSGPLLL